MDLNQIRMKRRKQNSVILLSAAQNTIMPNRANPQPYKSENTLSEEVDASEWRDTLLGDLDRLEEWANKNLTRFNKDQCKVLHLGKHGAGVQHRLGSTRLGCSSVERDLGSWWTTSSI